MGKRWNSQDLTYLTRNYSLVDNKTLAENLCRSMQAIRHKACVLGLGKPRPIVDETYFDVIDTPARAYWLGLLWADGSIWKRRGYDSYTLKLELQVEDGYLIEMFARVISSTIRPRRTKKRTSRLDIHNYRLCQDLISHGIWPDKTHSSSFPRCQTELLPHFLRGVFDGDGSVYIDRQSNQPGFSIAGNKALCVFVKDYIGFGSVSTCGNQNDTHQWKSCGKNVARKFYDLIYNDDFFKSSCDEMPHLGRKRRIFEGSFRRNL